MKPQLETIPLENNSASIHFFKRDVAFFEPYWHYHPELELTLIKKGLGMRTVGDQIENYEENDLVLLGANLPHNYVSTPMEIPSNSIAYVFQFSQHLFDSFPECAVLYKLFSSARKGIKFENPPEQLLKKIEAYEDLTPLQGLISFLEILLALCDHVAQRNLSSVSFKENPLANKYQNRVSEVTSYIFENFSKNIKLEQVAQFSGMTTNSFCRWFKQSTGLTFVTYLNRLRIERACHYLLQTNWLISEIAYQTGFESIPHFNRTFKKLKAQSPKDYRKRIVRS